MTLDGGVLLWIQAHLRGPVQDAAVSFYTTLGNAGVIFILLAVLMLCFRKTRRTGLTALLALTIGFVFTNLILKNLIARPRPWLDVTGLIALVVEHDPNSFPSGHTTAAFAFAGALWHASPEKWMKWTAVVAAILMGYSRLHIGVHYPSDVLAGVLVGLCAGWIAWKLIKKGQFNEKFPNLF